MPERFIVSISNVQATLKSQILSNTVIFFLKIYLFLATPGLHSCTWASLAELSRGYSWLQCVLLTAMASLVHEHGPTVRALSSCVTWV